MMESLRSFFFIYIRHSYGGYMVRQAKDYIIFPLDVPSIDAAKHYVELLADWVGLFKVGLELFIRSGPEIVKIINESGAAGVFLDLKLHDIPATVKLIHRLEAAGCEIIRVAVPDMPAAEAFPPIFTGPTDTCRVFFRWI